MALNFAPSLGRKNIFSTIPDFKKFTPSFALQFMNHNLKKSPLKAK
jgi:hypothetical protein